MGGCTPEWAHGRGHRGRGWGVEGDRVTRHLTAWTVPLPPQPAGAGVLLGAAAPARRDCGVDRPRRRGHHGPGCRGDPALWAVPAREVDRPVDGRPLGRGTPAPGSAAEIAHRCQVPISRVYDATRTLGPFPSPLQGAAGTVSLHGISRMSGVSLPALTLRLRRGIPARPCRSRPARLAVLEHRRHPRLARRLHTAGLPPLPRPGATPRQSPAPEP